MTFRSRRLRGAWLALMAVALVTGGCVGQRSAEELEADALARGIQAHGEGRMTEAIAAYFETLSHNPQNKYAYYNLGQIARVSDRFVAAESYYRLAIEIDPQFGLALFGLGYIRAAAGSAEEAIDLYRRAATAEPNLAAAHYNLGLLLRAAGRQAEGDAAIAKALELDPTVGPRPAAGGSTSTPGQQPAPSPTGR